MPDDSESPETTESPEDATATSAAATSEPEEPTYNLGLRAECQIDDVVQLGDTGPNVECLEQRLDQVTTGGVHFEVDDEFDDDTDAAIRQLQEANDLMVDGIVGPETGQLLSIWNPETE
ncbi:MAG: peptidoglycan-binding domain-containing protein [Acidimicrobiales bacterium]